MQNLKLFLVTLLFLSMTMIEMTSAQTGPRGRGPRYNPHQGPHRPMPDYRRPAPRPMPRDDYYSRGRVTCSASDKGWEEHFGGHGSCGSCLQKHSSCVEKCQEIREVCEVEGRDYNGRLSVFVGRGADRWAAEAEARRQCEWNRNMRSCMVTTCRQEAQTISTRSCR